MDNDTRITTPLSNDDKTFLALGYLERMTATVGELLSIDDGEYLQWAIGRLREVVHA